MKSLIEEILPGLDLQRHPNVGGMITALMKKTPPNFPIVIWTEQTMRYLNYWYWWTGHIFEEQVGQDDTGEPMYRFPLKINPIRSYSRLHNSILWGEYDDNALLPVTFSVKPFDIYGPSKELSETADFLKNIIHTVWDQSNGGSILVEGGLLSQWLGGVYYQICYQPWKTNLPIPGIWIKMLKPDFVLPIWDPDDEFKIKECYIVYRISGETAKRVYGVKEPSSTVGMVSYIEHWTESQYSIMVDNEYVIMDAGSGQLMEYKDVPNPFGFVPVYYIPRLREGNFYGSSLIPDIAGLVMEYNSRYADLGDIVRDQANVKYFGKNLGPVRRKQLDGGLAYYDIGNQPPGVSSSPELSSDTPPSFTDSMTKYMSGLQNQMERESNLSPINFGVDEGSQRSGNTLGIRMHPTIAMARVQRKNWQTGFNQMNRGVISVICSLGISVAGRAITEDMCNKFYHYSKWAAYIPKDEEQLVNRIVLLRQSKNMSRKRALELQSDVENVEEELRLIEEEIEEEREASIQEQSSAKTDSAEPVASMDAEDGD